MKKKKKLSSNRSGKKQESVPASLQRGWRLLCKLKLLTSSRNWLSGTVHSRTATASPDHPQSATESGSLASKSWTIKVHQGLSHTQPHSFPVTVPIRHKDLSVHSEFWPSVTSDTAVPLHSMERKFRTYSSSFSQVEHKRAAVWPPDWHFHSWFLRGVEVQASWASLPAQEPAPRLSNFSSRLDSSLRLYSHCPDQSNLKKASLGSVWKWSSSLHRGPLWVHSQEAEGDECCCYTHFLFSFWVPRPWDGAAYTQGGSFGLS